MDKFAPFSFDPTAFMTGQLESKLWLCAALEGVLKAETSRLAPYTKPVPSLGHPMGANIWVLAGWYCLTNLLLRTRNSMLIRKVHSFDSDEEATHGARILNEAFELREEFAAHTLDINTLSYMDGEYGGTPDILINTAVEHIDGRGWWDNLTRDSCTPLVVLQSNDMEHLDEHINTVTSEDDLLEQFPMTRVLYRGSKHFDYDTWSFNRFMLIGYK